MSKLDDDFIPQVDASESEHNLELNSEESDIAIGAETEANSDEDNEFIAKSEKVGISSTLPVTRRRSRNIVTGSPGRTRITNNAITMKEVFNMFFDDIIVATICTYTILQATRVIQEINANAASNRIGT